MKFYPKWSLFSEQVTYTLFITKPQQVRYKYIATPVALLHSENTILIIIMHNNNIIITPRACARGKAIDLSIDNREGKMDWKRVDDVQFG